VEIRTKTAHQLQQQSISHLLPFCRALNHAGAAETIANTWVVVLKEDAGRDVAAATARYEYARWQYCLAAMGYVLQMRPCCPGPLTLLQTLN
jgi:hypothetical protein